MCGTELQRTMSNWSWCTVDRSEQRMKHMSKKRRESSESLELGGDGT